MLTRVDYYIPDILKWDKNIKNMMGVWKSLPNTSVLEKVRNENLKGEMAEFRKGNKTIILEIKSNKKKWIVNAIANA